MSKKYPLIVVALNNWNGMLIKYKDKPILESCLKSLIKVDYPNLKFVMVDAGSDNSSDYVKKNFPQISVRKIADKGTAYSSNELIRLALDKYPDAEYVALIQNDLEFNERGWLKKMVKAAEKDKSIGAIECKLRDPVTGGIQYGGVVLSSLVVVRMLDDETQARKSRYVDIVSTMLLLVRKELIMKIGGMDEVYSPFCWEDGDFSERARRAGYRLYYVGNTDVYHLGDYSLRSKVVKKQWTSEQIEFAKRRNAYIFHLRYPSYRLPLHFFTDAVSDVIGVDGGGFHIRKDFVSRTKTHAPVVKEALKLYKKDMIRRFAKKMKPWENQ